MNEQEKRGLDMKLARWAWPDASVSYRIRDEQPYLTVVDQGDLVFHGTPFTESLDAQAQHLWPKLGCFNLAYSGRTYDAECYAKGTPDDNPVSGWARTESPALACAIAIGSLIDAQNPDRIAQLAEAQSQHNDGWTAKRAQEQANG